MRKNPLRRLGRLTSLSNALQNLLTVLVHPELGDDNLGGGDAEGNALAVGLLANNTLDVHNPLETVHAGDLALTALVGAPDDGDLVVLADGDGADLESVSPVSSTDVVPRSACLPEVFPRKRSSSIVPSLRYHSVQRFLETILGDRRRSESVWGRV